MCHPNHNQSELTNDAFPNSNFPQPQRTPSHSQPPTTVGVEQRGAQIVEWISSTELDLENTIITTSASPCNIPATTTTTSPPHSNLINNLQSSPIEHRTAKQERITHMHAKTSAALLPWLRLWAVTKKCFLVKIRHPLTLFFEVCFVFPSLC